MDCLENIKISEINEVFTVFSKKGTTNNMYCRPWYGLTFCKSGQITYSFDGKKYVSDEHTAIFLPKGKTYTLHNDKAGEFPVINFQCTTDFAYDFITIQLRNPESYIKDYEKMRELRLLPHNELKIISIFYGILSRLQNESVKNESPLSAAVSYIEKHYSDQQLSNTLLAEKAAISEVYMRQLFKKELGTSPKQLILEFRIKKAEMLLTESRKKVESIAFECGFASVHHFCRAFKEKTGLTPTQYARQNKAIQI